MAVLRAAVAQILSGPDPRANLALVAEAAEAAEAQGAQLVIFPEATMRRFGEPLAPVAEPVDGPWATRVREIASELGIAIVAGMFSPAGRRADAGGSLPGPFVEDGRVRNTLVATDGAQARSYDKIHLFDALGFVESRVVEAGEDLVVFDVGTAKIGLTTCYDVRFPWLYQELARRGAHVLVVSASWGAGPRKLDQWRLLTCARALDSTSYLLACGQADPGPTESSAPTGVGHSRIVSPFGDVLAEAGPAPELLVADLDLDTVDQARAALPVLAGGRGIPGDRGGHW